MRAEKLAQRHTESKSPSKDPNPGSSDPFLGREALTLPTLESEGQELPSVGLSLHLHSVAEAVPNTIEVVDLIPSSCS